MVHPDSFEGSQGQKLSFDCICRAKNLFLRSLIGSGVQGCLFWNILQTCGSGYPFRIFWKRVCTESGDVSLLTPHPLHSYPRLAALRSCRLHFHQEHCFPYHQVTQSAVRGEECFAYIGSTSLHDWEQGLKATATSVPALRGRTTEATLIQELITNMTWAFKGSEVQSCLVWCKVSCSVCGKPTVALQ